MQIFVNSSVEVFYIAQTSNLYRLPPSCISSSIYYKICRNNVTSPLIFALVQMLTTQGSSPLGAGRLSHSPLTRRNLIYSARRIMQISIDSLYVCLRAQQ